MTSKELRKLEDLIEYEEVVVIGVKVHNSSPDNFKDAVYAGRVKSLANLGLLFQFRKSCKKKYPPSFTEVSMLLESNEVSDRKRLKSQLISYALFTIVKRAKSLNNKVTDLVLDYKKSVSTKKSYFLRADAYIHKQ